MIRAWKFLVVAVLLLIGGCTSSKVFGVVGDGGDVFTGEMTGTGREGHIELDNGKGTRCVGEYVSHRPGSGSPTLIGMVVAVSAGSNGHTLLTCNNGERALIQFSSLSLDSGYGFGTTDQGRPIKFTYGLSRDQSAPYLQIPPTQTAGASGGASQSSRISAGTGFYITQQGHILTAAHVVEKCSEVTVASVGGAPATVSVVAKDVQNDLAVLMAPLPPPAVATFRTGRPVRPGDSVVAYGFPFTGSLSSGGSVTAGSVSALSGLRDDTRFLQVSAPIQPGNSGGPLLDSSGDVIGIVTSVLDAVKVVRATGAVPQNVNFAVKSEFAKTFLDANGIAVKAAAPGRELGTSDIGERARAFSVLIKCKG